MIGTFIFHMAIIKRILCRNVVGRVVWILAGVIIAGLLIPGATLAQSPVVVRYEEGEVHGFLTLSTLQGNAIADGDLTQVMHGDRITNHLTFHFKDGSVYEDTVVFSQRRNFRLISTHQVQKGPTFKNAMDVTLDGLNGQFTARYTDDSGKEKVESDRLKLPADIVANGMISTLLKNISPDVKQIGFSLVAATPKPRLVKLAISPEGEDAFTTGGASHKATRYVIKVDIGGVAGVVAPLVGKQPPDTHVWIVGGDAPAFVKLEGPLYADGPVWRIEMTCPVWQGH
jgi:hypothetical protein